MLLNSEDRNANLSPQSTIDKMKTKHKFKKGDTVKIISLKNMFPSHHRKDKKLLGEVGVIDHITGKGFPYFVKFKEMYFYCSDDNLKKVETKKRGGSIHRGKEKILSDMKFSLITFRRHNMIQKSEASGEIDILKEDVIDALFKLGYRITKQK